MNTSSQNRRGVAILILALLFLVSLFMNLVQLGQRMSMDVGFRMPAGEEMAGQEAFASLDCTRCHTVVGVDRFSEVDVDQGLEVPLGGPVHVVKTYGELVTAIIHPDESIRPDVMQKYDLENGLSLMPDYTTRMTTRQMIDLVTFLENHYQVEKPDFPSNYYPYGIEVAP